MYIFLMKSRVDPVMGTYLSKPLIYFIKYLDQYGRSETFWFFFLYILYI